MNLGSFFIDSIIVHDVPRRQPGDSVTDIVYSDVASNLSPALKNFFRERMIGSLKRQAFEVEEDSAQSSPVPEHVAKILGAPPTLVKRPRRSPSTFGIPSQESIPPGYSCSAPGRSTARAA